MNTVLAEGLALFFSGMVVHILVWRMHPIKSQLRFMGIIFAVLPLFVFGARFLLKGTDENPGVTWSIWLLAYLLHLSLSVSYFFLYTATLSPSLAMLEKLSRSMPRGLKRSDLRPDWFTDENFSGVRLANLLESGLVTESGGVLKLKPKGLKIARLFLIFRRVLGISDFGQG